ncbi:MAG TPA: glycoside hydrolase family 3 N-terminal domain-containing protein [Micromonosporaceae bacterium]|nr:glycoside hydrolase family 3 N-terminal domain-containing protein [Micromonosporaceae bacterium]
MVTDPALRRLALSTVLASFPGHEPPPWATELVGEGLAGHTIYGYNIADTTQLRRLTDTLRAARHDVLLAIDEEGGDVTRLAHATGSPYPGNAALGAVGDLTLTRRVYRAIGGELAAVGVNLNLAPTVDVNTADDNPVIGTRSFGADAVHVAAHAAAAVVGLQQTGVAACAKHFPGHGATVTDSHLELPTVDVSLDTLHRRELPPFAAVVAADAKAVMTAHIRVPRLTGDDPATFSRRALVDVLRGDLGFTGVVVTDALEMQGAAATAGGVAAAAVRALAAGADLLCIGSEVDAAMVEAVAAEIVAAMRDGRLGFARVEEASAHIAALSAWTLGHARDESDPQLGYDAARRAVRVEGSLDGLGTPLVVQLESGFSIAEGDVPWGLGPHIGGLAQLRVDAADTTIDALIDAAAGRPIVLVGRNMHRTPATRALVEDLAKAHPVVVVEMGWPSAWRPAGARAFIVTYGASHANGRAAAVALGLAG